jgi:tRNA A-37 threonylcarbamoyl transferase component Bud32
LGGRIRVPRVTGFVMSEKHGFIHGFLLDAIDNHGSVWERAGDTPVAEREKWYEDVCRMVGVLHEAGIVWGDVKPENMIVDEEGEVWLVDFGGGWTKGWVDPDKMETEEGDLQGLAELKDFRGLT